MNTWIPIEKIYKDGRYLGIIIKRQLIEGDEKHPIVYVEAEVEVPGTKVTINLGDFSSLEDAAWSYDFAATLLHTACTAPGQEGPKLNHASSSRGSVKMRESAAYQALAQRLAAFGGDAQAIVGDLELQRSIVHTARAYRHGGWQSDRQRRMADFRAYVKEPLGRFMGRSRAEAVAFTSDHNYPYSSLAPGPDNNEAQLQGRDADKVSSLCYRRKAAWPDFVACLASYPIAGEAPVQAHADQNMPAMPALAHDRGDQPMQTLHPAMQAPVHPRGHQDMQTLPDAQTMQPLAPDHGDQNMQPIAYDLGHQNMQTLQDRQNMQTMETAGDGFNISTLDKFPPDMFTATADPTFGLTSDIITNAGTKSFIDMLVYHAEPMTDALANLGLSPDYRMVTNDGTNNNIDMLDQTEPRADALATFNYHGMINDVSMYPVISPDHYLV